MNSLRHIGRRHFHFEAIDSTNNRARDLASDPANAGTVITSDLQSQGRGQHGRVWQSQPAASVLLSTLIFPPSALRRPAVLTAFASVAVAETILQATGRQSTIKWPNDVLLDGKKICGILIEGGSGPGVLPHSIVGIGLNVNQSADYFRQMELPDATSLSIVVGRALEIRGITQLLIQNLDEWYKRLLAGELAELEECWAWRLGKAGQVTTVELTDANELRGRLRRIGFDALELELSGGEVRLLRPEEVRHLR